MTDVPPTEYTDWQRAQGHMTGQIPLRTLEQARAKHGGEREVSECSKCHDCHRPYGDAHGFPDLIIPYDAWRRISPSGDDGGLLCPSCICKRLHDAGIGCEGAFMSGPIVSVSTATMSALRRVENIELAIDGRNNRWSGIREMKPLIRELVNALGALDPNVEGYYVGDKISKLIARAKEALEND